MSPSGFRIYRDDNYSDTEGRASAERAQTAQTAIESIKTFSLDTLGSGDVIKQVQVMDLKGKVDATRSTSIFGHIPPDTIVALWEPLEIAEQSKSYLDRLPEVHLPHLPFGG